MVSGLISLFIFLTGVTIVNTFIQDEACRHGWYHFRDRCYMFSADEETWVNAEFHCRVFGGHLVEIPDAGTQEFIEDTVSKAGGLRHDYFIGLTDEAQTNNWEWVESITAPNFTKWGNNQPDHQHHGEHCVFLLHDEGFSWHDVDCNDHNRFICEKEEINVDIIG